MININMKNGITITAIYLHTAKDNIVKAWTDQGLKTLHFDDILNITFGE